MKSISITLLLCFSFGLIQQANAQDNCETLTAKVNALYIQLNTQKNTQNNCVMQKNAATESWKAAKNRRDKNGMATAELAANSAEQQWKAAGTEIDKTNRSIKFAEDRQKTVCKKEKAAAGNVNRPNDGIPSMNIMSVGWYPKGTTTTLNGSVYDIGGFTEQQRISLKGTSDRFSLQTRTNDEYLRIKPVADKNLLTKSVETSGSTSIANPTAQKSLPPPPSTPPASGVMPPKPTAPKSAAVGTVAPTPATTTSTPQAPPLPSTAPPATTMSTPKAPPLPSTPPPATPNTPSTSPNAIVPQNEAQKKELELRQMQTAEAIKNKQAPATTPSPYSSFGTAPATPNTPSTSPNTIVPQNEAQKKELELRQMQTAEAIKNKQAPATTPSPYSSFGTAPASATNPSSATTSNPAAGTSPAATPVTIHLPPTGAQTPALSNTAPASATNPSSATVSNPTAAPKTGGYGSNASTTTTSTPAASSAPSISGAQSYSIPGVDMSMLTIQQQKRVKDDCGNDAGCANKTTNGLRDVKREQQIKQSRQDSLDAVYKNSGPVKKAWMVLSKANQEDVAYIMSGSVPILKEDFQKLCIKESSTENYNFIEIWLKQRQFNNVTKEWSQATYNRFIGAKPSASPFDGAPAPMNLGTEELKLVNRDIETNGYVSFNTYEAIYQSIRKLFQNDTYKRWKDMVEKNER